MPSNACRLVPILIAILGTAAGAAAPDAPALGATKLRVLVVTGGHDFEKPPFWALFDTPWLDVTRVDEEATKKSFLSGDVTGFDAIVLYDMWQPITAEDQKKLLGLLEHGQGLIVLHHAMADYQAWPEFARISGCRFFLGPTTWEGADRKTSGYLHDVDLEVKVADPGHPVTRGVKDFSIHDETYKGYWVDPKAKVLLTTDHPTSEKAVAWTRTHGPSRVVGIQLGHDGKAYGNPAFRTILHNAIRYVSAGDGKVALFDGKGLKGWEKRGGAQWTVEDGVLVGKQGPGNAEGDLFTRGEWSDYELKVVFQVVWPANSGIWFRFVDDGRCYQADILEMAGAMTGSIYRPGPGLFAARNEDVSMFRKDGWNTMEIRAVGESLRVTLNGKKVAEAKDSLSSWGRIGFQVHGGEFGAMRIKVKEAVLETIR